MQLNGDVQSQNVGLGHSNDVDADSIVHLALKSQMEEGRRKYLLQYPQYYQWHMQSQSENHLHESHRATQASDDRFFYLKQVFQLPEWEGGARRGHRLTCEPAEVRRV